MDKEKKSKKDHFLNILSSYLRSHLSTVLLYLVFTGVFGIIFFLYRVELEAVLYAAGLCLLLLFIFVPIHFIRYYKKHKELFSKPSEVFKLIKAVKDNPTFFYTNNQPNIALIGSILENGKLGKIGIQKDFNSDNLQVRHATYSSNAKKENERLLKRNSYPVGSPTPTQLTFGKTAETRANGAKSPKMERQA